MMKVIYQSASFVSFAAFAFMLLVAPQSSSAATPAQHNIVLFLIDDLGWMDLGCQGSDFYRTPHIDQLAAEGVRFTDAYAACAVCSPTRASILTGKYPARLLLTDWLPSGRWDPRAKLIEGSQGARLTRRRGHARGSFCAMRAIARSMLASGILVANRFVFLSITALRSTLPGMPTGHPGSTSFLTKAIGGSRRQSIERAGTCCPTESRVSI